MRLPHSRALHQLPLKKAKRAGSGSAAVVVFAAAPTMKASAVRAVIAPNDHSRRLDRRAEESVATKRFQSMTLIAVRATAVIAAANYW